MTEKRPSKEDGSKRRRRRRKKVAHIGEDEDGGDSKDDESTSIVRKWHKHGEHKAGMSMTTGGFREHMVKHKPGEKMLTWRAMPTTASYNIMCSKRYGTLLADSPYFDPDKIQKLMEKKIEEQLKMARRNGVIDQAVAAKALAKKKEEEKKEMLRKLAERKNKKLMDAQVVPAEESDEVAFSVMESIKLASKPKGKAAGGWTDPRDQADGGGGETKKGKGKGKGGGGPIIN